MADLSTWYNQGLYLMSIGTIDFDTTDSIRMCLCTKAYTPSAADDDECSDLTVTTATNYTNKALASANITVSENADGSVYFDYTDSIVWTSLGNGTNESIRYAVVYFNDGASTNDGKLLACLDFGSGTIKSTNGSDFKVTINASGIGKIATS